MTVKLMAGIDLHSNNLFCGIVDLEGKRVFEKKLPCELDAVVRALKPFQKRLEKIAVESTYNWYWLVDGLQDQGYDVVLANPAAMQQYDGLKQADDKSDAFFLAEMTRLVVACGGKAETMAGLAGLGDLVLTCTGGLSRNRGVGVELGRGRKLPEILAGMHGMVAEGIFTTTAAVGLARARSVEMPITEQMHAILHEGKAPRAAIYELMTRSSKSETLRT